ncbi:TonB-dependent receptor domain-containing protein [Flavobacterium suzhouense]|uniref:TonB-dependent receptor domain-containing protein n=1 Tax=Flavobacterium suzhouense TaxID=1529638 RepID=A0ABW5NPE5_9FLAO
MKHLFTTILLATSFSIFSQENTTDTIKKMDKELDEVVIQKNKKAVERKADRTIYNFSDQSHLNSGSLMEGLKKLPGLIISEVAGMMYQGKQLQVYMDGRPLNIYSNELNAYLEGMPANAIEKVEIITNPGAEFPATSGGAIINIVTAKNAKRYLTATYSNGYSYTKYTKSRNRFNNSLMLSAANKVFSWQIQGGQNYSESYTKTRLTDNDIVVTQNYSDNISRFYYLKTGVKFDFKKDRLLLNYDINGNNNNSFVQADGNGFTSDDKSKSKRYYNDVMAIYQKRFENPETKLDFRFNYNDGNSNFDLNSRADNNPVLDNNSDKKYYQFKTDYSQEIDLLDKTKFSAGILAEQLDFEAKNFGIENLDYSRTILAAYSEGQANYKKFDFILGARLESYDVKGTTDTDDLIPFRQTRFFPNATIQYTLIPQVYFKANYNKKISLPNTSALNPNNTSYQNPNIGFYGNPYLDPTIYNNYEVELSAFEYFTIGYSFTHADNQIINRIISTPNGAASITQNVPKVTYRNFNFGIPLPFMLITKGLTETLKMDFNPDEINFMYIYAGNSKQIIDGLDTKGIWNMNAMVQLLLPKKIKFTTNYSTSNTGGNYYYYSIEKPMNHQLDLTFAKKFFSDNLSVSLYLNDALNTNRQEFAMAGTNLNYKTKYDTRRIGFSLTYKIPSKNKNSQETDILNNDKKQEQQNILGN